MKSAGVAAALEARASVAVRVPRQAPSFAEAIAAIEALVASDRADPLIQSVALPRLYHHGKETARAVVLYHGFTGCPQGFDELARRFYERGCNVYVPRLPFHGYRDRLTRALEHLTCTLLQILTIESYQLTRGLGRHVTALGGSLGGSMTLYLAQTQQIDHAVSVSPFFMPIGFPVWLGLPVMTALALLPDHYIRSNPRIVPAYAYLGFPSHALAECVFFGNIVLQASKSKTPPIAPHCTLVTNRTENAVNNNVAFQVLEGWKSSGARYDRVVLSDLGPPRHDIIDPTTFPQSRTLVYPKLEEIVLGA